ncbi:hypothetical protein OK074_4979 [Actinobacteria bacterium OK074]|nr:hypothetical protein OK074_4979 [Actinobacteria bacterium OK074]
MPLAHDHEATARMLRGRYPSEALRRAAFGAVAELAYLAGGSTTTSARKTPPSATTSSPAKPIRTATPLG